MDLAIELYRTHPDYVVYAPPGLDRSLSNTGNEHFLVEQLREGNLFTIWTQSSYEGEPDQHIVFSKSTDGGQTWLEPKTIAGPDAERGIDMASWAFPLVSKQGRIYVIFSRHIGINDIYTHTTGVMACIYSDDEGETWSEEFRISMPHSIWDNPDRSFPSNWIVWQKPLRLSQGKYYSGFTRWVSPAANAKPVSSVVEFMRFENVDDNPSPDELEISFFMSNEKALRVDGDLQEPSIITLPDQRLFCVMRSSLGSPFYTISEDEGETWAEPLPLRQYDDGPILPHPLSPCPIYQLDEASAVFFYHNHDGHFLRYRPQDGEPHRRPICLARGDFQPGKKQPMCFTDPFYFMDTGGIKMLREGLSLYASTTPIEGGFILWYPDRKFFLLGKRILKEELAALSVPVPA